MIKYTCNYLSPAKTKIMRNVSAVLLQRLRHFLRTDDVTASNVQRCAYKRSGLCLKFSCYLVVVVIALLFYVHGKHLRSCRDGQLT